MVMTPPDAEAVLKFWLHEVGPRNWYRASPELDAACRERFQAVWEAARREDWLGWTPSPRTTLAMVILLDQLPRNMFRGSAQAYASDQLARARAKTAIDRNWDKRLPEPERQFFYLPLMHSECLADQNRAVRLVKERLAEGADTLLHAKAHREVIRRFGRFPHRNAEIGRATTAPEAEFLAEGGYRRLVDSLTVPG